MKKMRFSHFPTDSSQTRWLAAAKLNFAYSASKLMFFWPWWQKVKKQKQDQTIAGISASYYTHPFNIHHFCQIPLNDVEQWKVITEHVIITLYIHRPTVSKISDLICDLVVISHILYVVCEVCIFFFSDVCKNYVTFYNSFIIVTWLKVGKHQNCSGLGQKWFFFSVFKQYML